MMRTQLAVCRNPWPRPEPESAPRDARAAGSAPQVDEQDSARALREAALARCGLGLEHCLRPHGRLDASLVAALRVLAARPAELAAVASGQADPRQACHSCCSRRVRCGLLLHMLSCSCQLGVHARAVEQHC